MTFHHDPLPPCLAFLSRFNQEQLQDSLANDDVSTDEELIEFWVTECSIPKDAADAAITYRSKFFLDNFLDLFGLHTLPPS